MLGGQIGGVNYEQEKQLAMANSISPATIQDRLRGEQERLERRLKEIKEALEIIERNPDTERLLTLMSRGLGL